MYQFRSSCISDAHIAHDDTTFGSCFRVYFLRLLGGPVFYVRGGQLVDWDRLENFLLTRDRPVGNKVTSTKC